MSFRNFMLFAVFLAFPLFSFALRPQSESDSGRTIDQSALIQQLQKQVEELTKQIQALQQQLGTVQSELGAPALTPNLDVGRLSDEIPATETTSTETPPEFTKTLSRGSSGDEVRKLQEFLSKDKEIYPDGLITGYFGPKTEEALKKWQKKHNIEQIGILGPQSRARFLELGHGRIKELITEGAPTAVGGVIPPGLQTAPGIQKKVEVSTTTQATSTQATTTPNPPAGGSHPRPDSCAVSNNYCINSDECSKNGYYWCRNSCYTTESACLGQVFIAPTIPAVPATPAQPTAQTGATTVPATPAIPAVPAIIATSTTARGDITPPSTPTGLSATSYSPYGITLTWNKSTDNVGVTGYKLYRNGTQILSEATSSSISTIYFTDGVGFGLTPSTSYSYTVAAYDAAGNVSAQSSAVSATTLASQTQITSSCSYYSTGIAAKNNSSIFGRSDKFSVGENILNEITAYNSLYTQCSSFYLKVKLLKTDNATYRTLIKEEEFNNNISSPYIHTLYTSNLAAGSYEMQFCFNSICSRLVGSGFALIAPEADTTAPSIPTGLTATAVSSTQINLSWTVSTDNVGVVGYHIYRNYDSFPYASVSSTTYSNQNISPGVKYWYTVAAYDAAGNISAQSSPVSATTLATQTTTTNTGIGTCSGFSLVFKDNKTTYVIGDAVTYTYSCASGAASYVRMQVIKPDGTVTTYVTGTGSLTTQTMGFGTSNLVAGSHTLRACYDADCSFIADSKQFTMTMQTATTTATTTSNINSDTASRLAQISESLKNILNSLKLIR